jgi:hypothetical protein
MDCSRISGLPPSIEAPARKSAQIISKQYPRDLSDPSIAWETVLHAARFQAVSCRAAVWSSVYEQAWPYVICSSGLAFWCNARAWRR